MTSHSNTLRSQSIQGSIQLIVAAFIVSIFAGIILSVGINAWLKNNMNIILNEQKKTEAQRLEYLLENKKISEKSMTLSY